MEDVIYLSLFLAFFKTGLFSIGGGLATIPFLTDMGAQTGWFTHAELANMIAVSESTPGAMGINMATYVGLTTAGPLGAVAATVGLVTPSVIVILIIAQFLQKFRQSKLVDAAFYGLRPASTALIAAAGISVAVIALLHPGAATLAEHFNWPCILLAVLVFTGMKLKPLKKLHPVVFIAASALIGVIFQL